MKSLLWLGVSCLLVSIYAYASSTNSNKELNSYLTCARAIFRKKLSRSEKMGFYSSGSAPDIAVVNGVAKVENELNIGQYVYVRKTIHFYPQPDDADEYRISYPTEKNEGIAFVQLRPHTGISYSKQSDQKVRSIDEPEWSSDDSLAVIEDELRNIIRDVSKQYQQKVDLEYLPCITEKKPNCLLPNPGVYIDALSQCTNDDLALSQEAKREVANIQEVYAAVKAGERDTKVSGEPLKAHDKNEDVKIQ